MKYSKKIDGVYYVAETACESRYRKLWVLSAYIGKNKREPFTEAVDVTGPGLIVQNALPSQVSREGTVSQDSEPVNKYSIKEAEENATDKAILMFNDVEIRANFVLSYYGKDGFDNFIERNVEADTFLFIDKRKSRNRSNQAKREFFGKLDRYDFDIMIRKTNANVNPSQNEFFLQENADLSINIP